MCIAVERAWDCGHKDSRKTWSSECPLFLGYYCYRSPTESGEGQKGYAEKIERAGRRCLSCSKTPSSSPEIHSPASIADDEVPLTSNQSPIKKADQQKLDQVLDAPGHPIIESERQAASLRTRLFHIRRELKGYSYSREQFAREEALLDQSEILKWDQAARWHELRMVRGHAEGMSNDSPNSQGSKHGSRQYGLATSSFVSFNYTA